MTRLKAGQIDRLIDGLIRINGLSVSGGSATVTTQISTALSNAGDGGVSVPLQVAGTNAVGVVTTGSNQVPISNGTTKKPIKDASDNEVYARLTEASGAYTLTFFSINASGTETAYSFASATAIDFWFSYRYDFSRLPKDFALRYTVANVNEILAITQPTQTTYTEQLTVTAANTITALTKTPVNSTSVTLFVNGIGYFAALADFSVNTGTRAVTWNPVNTKYAIATDDIVIAQYETLQ